MAWPGSYNRLGLIKRKKKKEARAKIKSPKNERIQTVYKAAL